VPQGRPVLVDSLEPTHVGDEAIGVVFGAFDAAPCGERLLVVYGTPSDAYGSPSALRQVWGTWGADGLELGPPEVIFESERGDRRVFDVQLLETEGGGRVDLVFQFGPQLVHSSLTEGAELWARPSVLSETALPGSASLVVEGQRIQVAWSDQRYETMEGWAPINGRKLMLCSSADGGASFGDPVLIGSKDRRSDAVARTYLALLGDVPILFAKDDGTDRWARYVLDRDLQGYSTLEPVPESDLERAFEARMRPLLERGH